jgi:hypothetical protein
MANGSSAIPTPPLTLGMIVQAVDPTFGTGEFILLAGVASTAVGSTGHLQHSKLHNDALPGDG